MMLNFSSRYFKIIYIFFLFIVGINSKCFAAITVDSFVTADDVTIAHLEQFRQRTVNAINDFAGGDIQDGTITKNELDANTNPENRWNEAFNDFVYTGLTIPTSASLSSTTTSGTAYVYGARVVKDATAKTYTASKWTFVDLSNTGVYTYSEASIGGGEPSVASNSIRLARVSSDGTTIPSVRDDRVTTLTLAVGATAKLGTFTRDLSLASGNQSVTGVGYQPSAIIFLSVEVGTSEMSFGFDNDTLAYGIFDNNGTSSGTYTYAGFSTGAYQNSSNTYEGKISSFDSDGFTITWTKTGSPSGTLTVMYMAFR